MHDSTSRPHHARLYPKVTCGNGDCVPFGSSPVVELCSYTARVMLEDAVRYFQDLCENYRQMSDGELLQLAEKPEDLTEVAQEVLRGEIRRRRLDERGASTPREISGPVPRKNFDLFAGRSEEHTSELQSQSNL